MGGKLHPTAFLQNGLRADVDWNFFLAAYRCKRKKMGEKNASMDARMFDYANACFIHTHVSCQSPIHTCQHQNHHFQHADNYKTLSLCANKCIKITKNSISRLLPWTSEEMQHERATGSVCEVNSTGPLF